MFPLPHRLAWNLELILVSMPVHIKIMVSCLTLIAGALYFYFENRLGVPRLAFVGGGLAIFMVVAMWVFPETGKQTRAVTHPPKNANGNR